MIQLVFSILALFIGIALCSRIQKRPSWLSFFDAFVLVSIVGLALFHIIPHAIEDAGIWGMIAVAIGLGIPALFHKSQHHAHSHDDEDPTGDAKDENKSRVLQNVLMIIITVGICAHTLLDGIGLSLSSMGDGNSATGNLLSISVLFHRLPVGFFMSLMLVPRIGVKKTWGVASMMALCTVMGFILGHYALPLMGLTVLNVVQGLIAGMLLHVVFHNISVGGKREFRYAKGIGALLGILAFAFMTWIVPVHAHSHATPLDLWVDLLFKASPLWCLFACLLGIAYSLTKHPDSKWKRFGQTVCQCFDPQERPVSAGGSTHIFNAVSFILLFTLFDSAFAATWWLATSLAIGLTSIFLNKPETCLICEREGHCDTLKSFGTWLMTSIGTIAGVLLLASIVPFFAAPLTHELESASVVISSGIRSTFLILLLGALFFAAQKRHREHIDYMRYNTHIFVMFVILCVFNFGELSLSRFLFTAIVAVYGIVQMSYSESPLAIPLAEKPPFHNNLRFAACMLLPIGLFLGATLYGKSVERPSFAIAVSETVRAADEFKDSLEHEHEHETHANLKHEHEHEHETIANHEKGGHFGMPQIEHAISHGDGLALLRLMAFLFFLGTGLVFLLREGPRALFSSQTPHTHDDAHDD